MGDWILWREWIEIAARWLHVTAAIAWIGSSFYFIALDLGLRRGASLPPLAHGEEWQVHGGGFYHIRKYLVAPDFLPEHLIWFKWESYVTWLSGMAMLVLVYYLGADLFLIDPGVRELETWQAVGLSLASLALAWLLYDAICRLLVGANQTLVMVLLFAVLVAMAWFYVSVFPGRAALLHLGAATATIMSANVFLIIIPNQKIVVADLRAGRTPDARYGRIAKQRSTHNNYLTLPVLFLMLSNHYPLVFATRWNWVIACLVFLMGVTIRHWFNTRHARRGNPWWTWAATVALFVAIAWLSTRPAGAPPGEGATSESAGLESGGAGFDSIVEIVQTRCAMCHAQEPLWPGMRLAPRGVVLETPEEIAREARRITLQAGLSHAMPPANITGIEPEERRRIAEWYLAGAAADTTGL